MTVHPQVTKFASLLSFTMDPFQVAACQAVESGDGVLVCAPTGAGKTIVGEFAVHLALEAGTKCFYTTPIKALSNQKYSEMCRRYGHNNVGLLTGDSSINSSAPVVIMTTEVLRNMLYANSTNLEGLSHVVMDEVHFLADRFRGAVWEEIILHLPHNVRLISLSATVSNAEEFGAWIQTVRGDTTVIVDENRPIPLFQHLLVGRRLFDLFDARAAEHNRAGSSKLVVDRDLVAYIKQREAIASAPSFDKRDVRPRRSRGQISDRHNGAGRDRRGAHRRAGKDPSKPIARPDVIALLDKQGLLPAITFIFSRAGCDGAVTQCLHSPLRLTSQEQVAAIGEIIDRHIADLSPGDLEVLNYSSFREAAIRGFASHHAGMLPAFRHAVEELFVKGLIRAVFATETLALGINMPARTVVLEKLVKFNGESHAELTPGEYTQLTGRAGRRGIDVEGHAVVLWQSGIRPQEVAGLAGARTFPLISSFTPGYNMSINLLRRMGLAGTRRLLDRSFAQFQADRSVVGLTRAVEDGEREARKLELEISRQIELDTVADEPIDFLEYVSIRERIKARERQLRREKLLDKTTQSLEALSSLKRGDVIALDGGRRPGLAVVIDSASDPRDPRPLVVSETGWCGRVSGSDFVAAPPAIGTVSLPKNAQARTGRERRDIASTVRNSGVVAPTGRRKKHRAKAADDKELNLLKRQLRSHPAHTLPRHDHLNRLAERYARVGRDTDTKRDKVAATTNSLAKQFDRIIRVLSELEYIERCDDDWDLSAHGVRLGRIYSESDLLVCECLRERHWENLNFAELAAVVSTVVYESRGDRGTTTIAGSAHVSSAIRNAAAATVSTWARIRDLEIVHSLPVTREPDVGFVSAISQWAAGGELSSALIAAGDRGQPLSAGDFVRWCRQVIDLLDQIHKTSAEDYPALAKNAQLAITGIRRGVVAVDNN